MSTASNSNKAKAENLTGHDYDGIQEFDNPTPGWWSAIFVGTIVFAVAYVFWYHGGGPGEGRIATYEKSVAENDKLVAAAKPAVSEDVLAAKAADAAMTAKGKAVFTQWCIACHRPDGGGGAGPNLTDSNQLHGTTRMDIYNTIHDGVPGKPMIAWGPTLPAGDLVNVAAFVSSLRHTNVANGKAPEGPAVSPFPK